MLYRFGLAGINLTIDSSVPLKGLAYERFAAFLEETSSSQITLVYNEIELDAKKAMAGIASIKALIKENKQITGHIFNNPLFYSRDVLRELESCSGHMDMVYIDSNQSSLSIYDFFSNQLKVFFCKSMSRFMRDSRMGPYSIAPFFIPFSGAMIHSAALVRSKKAAVFLSPDEGGKTTSIRLSAEGTVLSDDQNIIRRISGQVMIFGTPWGRHFANDSAPVGAFFILEKTGRFFISQEEKHALLGYLWNEHLAYHFFLPRKISEKHFDFLFQVCRHTPVYRLGFPKDYIDWDAVDKAMQ
jgi:hypothetical protein